MTFVWAGLIFYLSTSGFGVSFTAWLVSVGLRILHLTVSPATFDELDFLLRKLAHLTEYGILSLFVFHCFKEGRRSAWNFRVALWSILIAGAYSLTDEFHQIFVPGRTPSIKDCGVDTIGATLGMVFLFCFTRVLPSRRLPASAPARDATTP